MFHVVERYFWLIGIIFSLWDHYQWTTRRKDVVARKPELADSYGLVMWSNTVFYSLPWLVMGLGIMLGRVNGVFDYLHPCSGNLFVVAFHLTIVLLVATVTIWVLLLGGGAYLARYMERSPLIVKLQCVGATLFVVFLIGLACWRSPAA
jgi:hypothetical protein